MDSTSMNPYEEQLYTVFKTFDVDNEEALDKSAVLDLCDALQLEDRGATLVDTLFEHPSDRVTFTQFRNGLLSVLSGSERPPAPTTAASTPGNPAPHSDEDSSGREVAPKFVFGSKKYGRRSRPQRSTSASGGSPRAASVSRLDSEENRIRSSQRMRCRRSASAMECRELNCTTDDDDPALAGFDHDRRIDCNQALALCHTLRMDGIDRSLVERIFYDLRADETTVGNFFDRLNSSLTSSIEVSVSSSIATHGDDNSDEDSEVACEVVVDAWERAGVPRPRRLLLDLGFASASVRPPDLERVLDDELAALPEPQGQRCDARYTLLMAALALGRLRTVRARRRADLASAERDKLRADVVEANKRARLLAQDVDESHARMEAELAASLRRAEARHAEAARKAADEAAAERERAAAARARLEAEVARRGEAEARARADLDAERTRADRLEARATAAEARASAAEREAARVAEEARKAGNVCGGGDGRAEDAAAAELATRLEELRQEAAALRDRNDELCALLEARGAAPAPAAVSPSAVGDLSAELRSLFEPLEECDSSPASIEQKMKIDHQEAARRLRTIFQTFRALSPVINKNCNSCVAIESLISDVGARVHELSEILVGGAESPPPRAPPEAAPSAPPEAAPSVPPEAASSAPHEAAPSVPPEAASSAPHEAAPSAPPAADHAALTDAAHERAIAVSATQTARAAAEHVATQTDATPAPIDGNVGSEESSAMELAGVARKHEEEKQKYNDFIRELESSLEQMREEYERCEEYWARKIDEERAAHDEERRAGDERLADLVARVADYERAFAPERARALPPIEERAALEAQVADLESEFAAQRERAARELRAREDEAAAWRARAEAAAAAAAAARRRRGECACAALAERCGRLGACLAAARGAGAREAAALRGRAARAEAALRRLQARLHAADLLVKDLYVENCQLARRPP